MSDAQTSPPSANSSAGRRGRTSRAMFVLAGLAGLVFVVYVSTRIFGHVSGEEFSPDSFERRVFEYYEIPLVHLQITPISRQDTTNSLERHLAGQKLFPVQAGPELRWDLVRARQGAQTTRHGDAGILCAYLDASDENGNLIWKTWTEKDAALAKVLWTAVDRLADQRLYLLVPDVFALANQATDAIAFQQEVDRALADCYENLARAQRELGHLETALELAEQGLHHAPQRETLKQLRVELKAEAEAGNP